MPQHSPKLVYHSALRDADDVACAAFSCRQGGADFSDLMILAASERAGPDRRQVEGAALVETGEVL